MYFFSTSTQTSKHRYDAIWEAPLYWVPNYTIRPSTLEHPTSDLLLLKHYYVSGRDPSFKPLGRVFCDCRLGDFSDYLGPGKRKDLQRHNLHELVSLLHLILFGYWKTNLNTTPSYHPISLLAHSSVGLWRTVPAYFTFYYLFSASKRLIPDSRCIRLSYAKSIIPALIVGFYVPSLWVSASPWSSLRFLLIPVTFCLLHRFLAGFIQDTTVEDRIQRPTADLIWIRVSYALAVLISGGISISRHLEVPEPTRSFKSLSLERTLNAQTIGIGSAVIWLILELKDVSQKKKLRLPWLYIAMALPLCLILVGPAATFALGWGLREEILARGYREKVTTDPLASKAHEMWSGFRIGI